MLRTGKGKQRRQRWDGEGLGGGKGYGLGGVGLGDTAWHWLGGVCRKSKHKGQHKQCLREVLLAGVNDGK